jgi:hypothetical protein
MSTETASVKMGKGPEDVVLFGTIDRKDKRKDGIVSSSYPAWYMDSQVEALREQIESTERALDRGFIPKDSVHESMALLSERKKKLEEIEKTRPRLNAAQSAWLKRSVCDLETNIKESMFSYDDMNFGVASPRDEMHRMTRACVKIDPLLASKCGCKIVDGKVSRNEAIRVLKIANKLTGRPTNAEYLRRSDLTCRTKRVDPFVGAVGEEDIGRESDAPSPA